LSDPPGDYRETRFAELNGVLKRGDLLVLNDTRVLPARLFGKKASGGRLEILLERVLDSAQALVQVRSSRSPRPGSVLMLDGGLSARVVSREDAFFILKFDGPVDQILQAHGHVPLPPYIDRPDQPADRDRYQTVYAQVPGAVAAPTAGLHFDRPLLRALEESGIEIAQLTLHVGAGTFHPVRQAQLDTGRLHAEFAEVSNAVCQAVAAARSRGGRIVAVGTTVVRALEAAARSGGLRPFHGNTDLFITSGFRFAVVDAMITNFHLPGSSLLMLVCAFRDRQEVLAAYAHAVRERFRFFSYGDAMFLTRRS
jgi:S-adenosylmethionine:tRNA ribosyltransferase-isomerase